MRTFKLIPIDGGKTFNNHHVNNYIIDGEEWSDLVSYTKRVASYNHTEDYISIYKCESATTQRHINAFLDFCGKETMNKQQIIKLIND